MTPPPELPVLLGLGANLGSPLRQLREALALLGAVVDLDAVSSVYRSEPVGFREQPDFYNLVCLGRTRLVPEALLREAQAVERELGRRRSFRNAPRPIDVDLLAYGDLVLETPVLTLPHPHLHERGFVLLPLVEVASGWRHPRLRRTAAELLAEAPRLERIERLGPLDEQDAQG